MKTGAEKGVRWRKGGRAASLVIALVFLSGTAVLVLSLLLLSRDETRYAYDAGQVERGRFAARAALEDAKSLLAGATANDRYLVSLIMAEPGNPESRSIASQSRYYYILDPRANGARCVPLFAGGEESIRSYPDDPHTGRFAPAPGELFRPEVEMGDAIEPFPLTHDTGSSLVRERSRVRTGWVYPFRSRTEGVLPAELEDASTEIRYTYWVEDLEGYPNLDMVGIPSGAGRDELALRWQGYEAADARVEAVLDRGDPGCRFEFPAAIAARPDGRLFSRAQRVAGQVSPGLSPREMHVYPWSKSYFESEANPYLGYSRLRSQPWMLPCSGTEVMMAPLLPRGMREAYARGIESRFAVGLWPYLARPMIPYGYGYVDEGRPAVNLNTLIHRCEVDLIAEVIQRNLSLFDSRKGGFPEDYLKTLAATVVDYADVDSGPTLSPGVYRGMDSFPVMNEVFLRLEYAGYYLSKDHQKFIARFCAEPFVELWNPGNREANLSGLSLRVSIPDLQGLVVKTGAGQTGDFRSRESNREGADHPEKLRLDICLKPNQYQVVAFGRLCWDFTFPTQGLAVLSFGRIQAGKAGLLGGKDGGNSRVHFELLWAPDPAKPEERVVIDSTGRPGPSGVGHEHGFHLGRYGETGDSADDMYRSAVPNTDNSLTTGEYMIRAAAPGLCVNQFEEATNYGDARMACYPHWAQKMVYYTWDGSPGYRNVLRTKASSGSCTHEVRIRDWPDGGYDSPAPPQARVLQLKRKQPVRPTDLGPPAEDDERPLLAAARISNEGRLYSLAELGNLFDPVMWRPDAATQASALTRQQVIEIPPGAVPSPCWGGGNSLRVGRKEHPKFDALGLRACQLLDLFHVGIPGTNCQFGGFTPEALSQGALPEDLYGEFDVLLHQPPPSAPNRQQALDQNLPFHRIYSADQHAESPLRWVQGHLNLNSAPTVLEIESLLRGPFVSPLVKWSGSGWEKQFGCVDLAGEKVAALARHGLDEEAVAEVARRIYESRPFLSASHLASVAGNALEPHLPRDETLPAAGRTRSYCSDALAEEIFARLHNATTLSSRHFRIYACGEAVSKAMRTPDGTVLREEGRVLARACRMEEVFLRPIRDGNGQIASLQLQVLNSRSW